LILEDEAADGEGTLALAYAWDALDLGELDGPDERDGTPELVR
jgi:hypothetical protein